MSIFMGVFFHLLGGFCAGSFYLPLKKVASWAWESYWIVNGIVAWLLVPALVAVFVVPEIACLYLTTDASSVMWCYVFGCLWGVGGVTFGLTMRFLGMALGMSIALGLTAIIGTLVPPAFAGHLLEILLTSAGQVTIGGVLLMMAGILVCGYAGCLREKSMNRGSSGSESAPEFDVQRGFFVALVAGVMSACMAFGIAAGKPIAESAVELGIQPVLQNIPVFVVIFFGGLTTNLLWCLYLNVRNCSYRDYLDTGTNLRKNYLFCFVAGLVWYCQFLFYGIGATYMGGYEFVGWSLHMGFIIFFSTMWGFVDGEWRDAGSGTLQINYLGLLILTLAVCLIGYGTYIGSEPGPA